MLQERRVDYPQIVAKLEQHGEVLATILERVDNIRSELKDHQNEADKVENRVRLLEEFKAGINGKVAVLSTIVSFSVAFAAAFLKSRGIL